VCSPDKTFSENARGPSGICWKKRFSLYKRVLLRFPDEKLTELLTWFDGQIFEQTKSSTTPSESFDQDLQEVDDLVGRLFQAGVSHHSSSTPVSSSGTTLAPVLVAELPEQTRAVVQAEKPVAADNELEQPPIPLDRRGRPKKPRGKNATKKKSK
jgi:hypothetical protein